VQIQAGFSNRTKIIDDIEKITTEKNGKYLGNILSGTKITTQDYGLFSCREGHQWEARFDRILNGNWCFKCNVGNNDRTYGEIRALCQSHLGQCLSNLDVPDATRIKVKTKLQFACGDGHIWTAFADSLLRGHWCKQCADYEKTLGKNLRRPSGGVATERPTKSRSKLLLRNASDLMSGVGAFDSRASIGVPLIGDPTQTGGVLYPGLRNK
jgi:hypothetical protein